MEDIQVIQRVQAGETEAFAILVSRYHRNLLNFIYRLMRDEALVEDLGQEVFLRAFRALPEFDADRGVPFGAWLFTLARNLCISEWRRSALREHVDVADVPELAAATPDAEALVIAQEQREALRRSLEQLPEPYRETILQSLEGRSLDEIAELQHVSTGTVKSRLFRARERVSSLVGIMNRGENNEGI